MKKYMKFIFYSILLPVLAYADGLKDQYHESLFRLEKNLSHNQVAQGAVIASPSRRDPDYFFHWVRDAALVMESYVDLLSSQDPAIRNLATNRLIKWMQFEVQTQNNAGLSSLGEPKFNVDGSVFTGPWGRPQNDGPALRARTLGLWAEKLIENGSLQFAKTFILNTNGPLKKDIEFTINHWRESSFDVWEEVKGDHFFTRLAQFKSVELASRLFAVVGDQAFSLKLTSVANEMKKELQTFWIKDENKIIPTLNQDSGWGHKKSNVDLTVLLASLYFTTEKEEFGLSDSRIISSTKQLKDSFSDYQINKNRIVFIGRYPEDVYDGLGFSGGNPWFLANMAYAQFQCRLSHEWGNSKNILVDSLNVDFLNEYLMPPYTLLKDESLNQNDIRFKLIVTALKDKARLYLERTLFHAGRDGSMSEQFSRINGYMTGAQDLSWSHASYLRAINECQKVMPDLL